MHVSKQMFADFEGYWRRLQETIAAAYPYKAGIPTRKQFNPMAVPKLLPNLYLIEYECEKALALKLRLTGTALDNAIQDLNTDQNLLDFYADEERDFFRSVHQHMREQPCGMVVRRHSALSSGTACVVTSKCMPLADRHENIKYALGIMGADLLFSTEARERAVIAGATITDFFYLDLGYGVPENTYDWTQSSLAS